MAEEDEDGEEVEEDMGEEVKVEKEVMREEKDIEEVEVVEVEEAEVDTVVHDDDKCQTNLQSRQTASMYGLSID